MRNTTLAYLSAFALVSSAHAIEMTAGSQNAQANASFEARLQASNAAFQAVMNQMFTCNNKGKIFASSATTPGRDADGCITANVPPPPPPPPAAAASMRLVPVSHQATHSSAGSSQQTTYTPWITADICVLWNVSPGTTEDNHSHGCWIELSGSNSYRTGSRSHKGNTRCDMLCYNLVAQ